MKLEILKKLPSDDAAVKVSSRHVLNLSVSFTLAGVQQHGSEIDGNVDAHVDFGIGSADVDFPFDIPTGVDNPITVDLGTVSTPIGDIDVGAEFGYDLVQRQISAVLTLDGVPVGNPVTANF